MNLQEKYEVSTKDVLFASVIRHIKGSRICPKFLHEYSLKHYGAKDNLARYYFEKYSNIISKRNRHSLTDNPAL